MNKSVYLYELDSVRNSKEEIQYAQERMFREIILNGNQVILTMNQLADSRAFLAAIENENTFEPFFELCQMGVIRISQYGTLRTPSQYFQGKIEEFLKKAEKLPVKLTTAFALILGVLSVSLLSAASCSVFWLLASNSSRGIRR